MKKRVGLVIISSFVIILGVLFFNKNLIKEHKINNVLKNEYYSYLPQEIKDDIKDVYLESGVIVKTEKNKEINVPYINPRYVEYKSLSKEEQKEVDLIPDVYTVDYDYRELKSGEELPSSFDLRTGSYLTPMKDQGQTGLCWAFSGVEQAESFLMLKNSQSYNSSTTKVFSPRQVDYATSANGIKDYTNPYGTRTLKTDGGNFAKFSVLASFGLSLIDETKMPFDESTNQKELNDVLNFNNSNYEVTETVDLPTIAEIASYDNTYMSDCSSNPSACEETIKAAYMEAIKRTVMNNGGALVSAVTPQGICGYGNTDGQKALSIHSVCYRSNTGHAMQVIGWDDNYSYAYCKTSTGNTSVSSNGTCASGTKVTGNGAFILRNSWGDNTSYKYIYLTYDSVSSYEYAPTFSSITNMTDTKDWDNLYNGTYSQGNNFSFGSSSTSTFTKKITGNEKLKKVKFHSLTANNTFNVIIKDGTLTYTYNNIATEELPGLYTIDLSDKNITLTNDTFSITVRENSNRYSVIADSISVFTSNISTTPQIQSNVNSLTFDPITNDMSKRIYSITKNIPSDELITYTLKNRNNQNVSYYLNVENNKVSQNDVNTILSLATGIPAGQYSLILSYSDGSETIPLSVLGNEINVSYIPNDGDGMTITENILRNQSFTLRPNPFHRTGYTYKNWNTKADGTGTTYNDQQTINGLLEDLDLYAQWQPITYKVRFDSNTGSGTMSDQTLTYDKTQFLTKSTFTKENYNFVSWNTKQDGSGTSYGDEEGVKNLSSTQDEVITLYAQWQRYAYHVHFFANDGTDNTQSQLMMVNTPTALAGNAFSRPNYEFTVWNTEPDGSGTTYVDGQEVTLTDGDLNLYAQWGVITYKVTFNPNSGTPSTPQIQGFNSGEDFQLIANPFTKTGYTFKGWNTNSSGTGTSYSDQQVLNLNHNLVLYAQWQPITYTVRFNKNHGFGTMDDQTFTYNQSKKLSKNTFTKPNHEFTGWTTNEDYTGYMYADEQTVSNLSTTQGEVINLYANWERVSYNIILMANNGTLDSETQEVSLNTTVNIMSNPFTNDGYIFMGWNTKSDGSGTTYSNEQAVTLEEDLILWAQWQTTTRNITFYSNFGAANLINHQTAPDGSTVKLDANTFFRTGYSFAGWNTNQDGSGTSYEDEQTIVEIHDDLLLYAQWQPNTYTIKFNANSGTGTMTNQTMTYDKNEALKANTFTKVGYTFKGWNTNSSGTGTSYSDRQSVKNLTTGSSVTLYAQWQPITYKVSFEPGYASGNTITQTITYDVSTKLQKFDYTYTTMWNQKETEYKGHSYVGFFGFKEWNTQKNGSGTSYTDEHEVLNLADEQDEVVRLYAQWQPSTYFVIFDSNNGTDEITDQAHSYNEQAQLKKNTFTKEGYVFTGWNTKADGSGTSYTDEQSVKNLTSNSLIFVLYAQWQKEEKKLSVTYRTHVQSYGWQDFVSDGAMSGTQGEAKRLEGIEIKLKNAPEGSGIKYRTHVQTYGWQDFVADGEMSGTSGEAKRLEAIEIQLTGDVAETHDVYYRVHAQTYGWLGWAKNGEKAGTAGYAKRLEGIEIVVLEKGQTPDGYDSSVKAYVHKSVIYRTHVQTYGWQDFVADGEMSGTSGEAKRLEGIEIQLVNQEYEGGIEYTTHVQSYGWQDYVGNGAMSGTSGEAKRLEAIQIRLTGDMAEHFDIYYRVHAQSYGWLAWACNDAPAGTAGLAKRLEGIEIVLVEKGESPPARDNQNNDKAYIENN